MKFYQLKSRIKYHKEYTELDRLSKQWFSEEKLTKTVIQDAVEGRGVKIGLLLRHDNFYSLLSASLLRNIFCELPKEYRAAYQEYALDIVLKEKFFRILANNEHRVWYLKDLAVAYAEVALFIFSENASNKKAAEIILHHENAGQYLSEIARAHKAVAIKIFKRESPLEQTMSNIILDHASAIKYLQAIAKAHHIEFYLQRNILDYSHAFESAVISNKKETSALFYRAFVKHTSDGSPRIGIL